MLIILAIYQRRGSPSAQNIAAEAEDGRSVRDGLALRASFQEMLLWFLMSLDLFMNEYLEIITNEEIVTSVT